MFATTRTGPLPPEISVLRSGDRMTADEFQRVYSRMPDRLGPNTEPQPDVYLRILPEHGGQSATTADDYVEGPPELIVEVSYSSWSLDLQA